MAAKGSRPERLRRASAYLRTRYHKAVGGYESVQLARRFDAEVRRWTNRDRPSWVQTTASTTCEYILEEALRQDLIFGAIDCEYWPGPPLTLTEVGFSRLDPATSTVQTNHYVYKGGKGKTAKKFRHGKSQHHACADMLRQELLVQLSKVDVVLFWGKHADLTALRTIGVHVPQAKIVDAVQLQSRMNYTNTQECHYSLGEFCEIQGLWLQSPHNAGNDSHMLLTSVMHAMGVLGEQFEMTEVDGASS